jgi:pilus assembly protein Flp/PilA
MIKKIMSFLKDEEGATMVEYAIMLALIAVFCITAVKLVGTGAEGSFNDSAAALGQTT